MINTLLLLLFCELLGEGAARMLPLPIPGPVLGMFLLLGALVLRDRAHPLRPSQSKSQSKSQLQGQIQGQLQGQLQGQRQLDETATALLSHLSLLFVPAGVGVMVHIQRIGSEWLPLVVALVLSTWVTMAVTAWTMQLMLRLQRGRILVHD